MKPSRCVPTKALSAPCRSCKQTAHPVHVVETGVILMVHIHSDHESKTSYPHEFYCERCCPVHGAPLLGSAA